uniref:C-type lectin domain-containing protein n=1 Tax=Panagrolaimus superbus TaxID=310955 RepID=A0A914YV46_9BILA
MMLRFFFFVVTFAVAKNACPSGFYEWHTDCYTFISNASGFADAENECIQKGGHLASIHDGFTNAWISQEASKYFVESTVSDFWIGLTDLINSGNWTWTDGTLMDFNKISFNSNLTSTNCISVSLINGQWHANDC